jgi:3-hydroxyisobutyrate dehydrogenase
MQTCDVVITMLSNDEAVRSFENENGLLSQDNPGKLIINMSTVSPETSLFKICTARHHFMDAPVSGSVKPAQDGTLVILVGGTDQDYMLAKPIF